MPNRRGATPQPHELLLVVPVVQTRALAEGSLTIVSLEVYAEGFLVHSQMRYADKRGTDAAPDAKAAPGIWRRGDFASPEVLFEATDDRGGTYGCWSGGGYGGGAAPGEMLWRRDYVFAPTLDPAARSLRLAISAVEWLSYGPATASPTIEATQPVGWTFSIPLA